MILSNEELKRSAHLSETLSKYTCDADTRNHNCGWYHGAWPYLRLLDIVGSPDWHKDFFTNVARSTLSPEGRVLISGTADHTMQALLVSASVEHKKNITYEIIDSCKTPLILNDWYGSRIGVEVSTMQADCRDPIEGIGEYDLIVTDEFLTRFNDSEKREIVEGWASLLSSGGRVATTCRIAEEDSISDEGETRSFAERARSKAKTLDDIPITMDRLYRIAERFADNYTEIASYPIESESAAATLFRESGFSSVEVSVVDHRTRENIAQCQIAATL